MYSKMAVVVEIDPSSITAMFWMQASLCCKSVDFSALFRKQYQLQTQPFAKRRVIGPWELRGRGLPEAGAILP